MKREIREKNEGGEWGTGTERIRRKGENELRKKTY